MHLIQKFLNGWFGVFALVVVAAVTLKFFAKDEDLWVRLAIVAGVALVASGVKWAAGKKAGG